MLRICSKKY